MKRDGELGAADRVLCVRATFDILTGPGEFLTYDPGTATRTLLELMPEIDLNKAWLPDGDSQILRSYVFGPSGLKDYGSATLCCKI